MRGTRQTHTVDNIIDIQYLHGYNQPMLLILYEPLKTCSLWQDCREEGHLQAGCDLS